MDIVQTEHNYSYLYFNNNHVVILGFRGRSQYYILNLPVPRLTQCEPVDVEYSS